MRYRLFSGGEFLPTPVFFNELLISLNGIALNYFQRRTVKLYAIYCRLGRGKGRQELAGSLEAAVRRPDSISGATKDPSANVDYVKSKINNLRSAFRKELKKIKKRNKGTGSGPQDVYVPKLWYFDLLGFLRDQDINQPSIANIDGELEGVEGPLYENWMVLLPDGENNSPDFGNKPVLEGLLSYHNTTIQLDYGKVLNESFQNGPPTEPISPLLLLLPLQ
ncbi:unnamed protein product [Timema podura]|uniref:MADF domain-containing protein n=1 Tax=Timema podura TaxID=61482 RepID=A0ABN7NTU5_TIMPD|nr:unnamed protein product [Timema podura]